MEASGSVHVFPILLCIPLRDLAHLSHHLRYHHHVTYVKDPVRTLCTGMHSVSFVRHVTDWRRHRRIMNANLVSGNVTRVSVNVIFVIGNVTLAIFGNVNTVTVTVTVTHRASAVTVIVIAIVSVTLLEVDAAARHALLVPLWTKRLWSGTPT